MKLGLGTVQLGMDYGIANATGKPSADSAFEILKAAVDGGIDCLDTAPAYGESEKIIGRFIKESGASLKLCSKFSCSAYAMAELQSSVERLGVDRLDYFLLHRPEQELDRAALTELRGSGLVRKIGVSVYTPRDVYRCLEHDIQVIQAPFNILDTRLEKSGLLAEIKKRGIELHARSIYLQGLLLMRDAPGSLAEVAGHLEKLDALSAGLGLDRKSLAFCYVRDCGYIDRFFIGCETARQIEENLELYKLPALPGGIYERIAYEFADVSERILNPVLWG